MAINELFPVVWFISIYIPNKPGLNSCHYALNVGIKAPINPISVTQLGSSDSVMDVTIIFHNTLRTILEVTTMFSTSKNVLFPGHNHLLTTSTDDPTLTGAKVINTGGLQVVMTWKYDNFRSG